MGLREREREDIRVIALTYQLSTELSGTKPQSQTEAAEPGFEATITQQVSMINPCLWVKGYGILCVCVCYHKIGSKPG